MRIVHGFHWGVNHYASKTASLQNMFAVVCTSLEIRNGRLLRMRTRMCMRALFKNTEIIMILTCHFKARNTNHWFWFVLQCTRDYYLLCWTLLHLWRALFDSASDFAWRVLKQDIKSCAYKIQIMCRHSNFAPKFSARIHLKFCAKQKGSRIILSNKCLMIPCLVHQLLHIIVHENSCIHVPIQIHILCAWKHVYIVAHTNS